jgi:hypothetical protein
MNYNWIHHSLSLQWEDYSLAFFCWDFLSEKKLCVCVYVYERECVRVREHEILSSYSDIYQFENI